VINVLYIYALFYSPLWLFIGHTHQLQRQTVKLRR